MSNTPVFCGRHEDTVLREGVCPQCCPAPPSGEWFTAYTDDINNTMGGPYATEAEALEEAKGAFKDDNDAEGEMVILRIVRRLKLFTRVEVEEVDR